MPLSTSSFKRPIPDPQIIKSLIVGLLGGLLLILAMENIIRFLGATPNVRETATLWAEQRRAAAQGNNETITIVGASRAQLGIDIEELETVSGSEVVQLAIDGSPYLRVLENLADDSDVKGTILVSTSLAWLSMDTSSARADQWVAEFEAGLNDSSFLALENSLVTGLQSISALYSSIVPLDRIARSIAGLDSYPINYVSNQRNRERNADYQLAPYPDVYVRNVVRTLDLPIEGESFPEIALFDRAVVVAARRGEIENPQPAINLASINALLEKFKEREVNVVFVHFPLSGAIEAINDIRFPKATWDSYTAELDALVIDYRDYSELDYELADGSHLDIRQKTEFTERLFHIIAQLSPRIRVN